MGERTVRSAGLTAAERSLSRLCERTFLSLWSYPGVYRDQLYGTIGEEGKQREGKEVADLLVVFERRIILFSDKDCAFPNSGNVHLDWQRWFRKAVLQSARQLWGAERWVRQHPDRLFLDRACGRRFPVDLPSDVIFHRVVVAHDVARQCQAAVGGSGSLIIRPTIVGDQHLRRPEDGGTPFVVGVLDPGKGFVHVLDDVSLDVLLGTLDTVSDFVRYLEHKEAAIASGRLIQASGEEDLLALYLQHANAERQHAFQAEAFRVEAGRWERFCVHPQRLAQIAANRISYAWDRLTEMFCQHLLGGTQAFASHPGVANQEVILRFLARENRTRRRMLAKALLELLDKTPSMQRATRTVLPSGPGDPHYVFLLLPRQPAVSEEQYRDVRRALLPAYLVVTKLHFPAAEHIVGIATETGDSELRSEDIAYLDARNWTAEMEEDARTKERELQDLGLLSARCPHAPSWSTRMLSRGRSGFRDGVLGAMSPVRAAVERSTSDVMAASVSGVCCC